MRWILLAFLIVMVSCQVQPQEQVQKKGSESMKLSSIAFQRGKGIPEAYTCDGSNVSPPLKIELVPPGTKSLVLMMDDPDAPRGTFVHWVVWNIPPSVTEIKEGQEPQGVQGMMDFKSLGYGGPCPPSGVHRYFFKVYALGVLLDLKTGATKSEVEKAMQNHVLAKAELMGTYARR